MIRPQSLSTFLNDSLALTVAVFDASGLPFDLAAYNIDVATLNIPSLEITAAATAISQNSLSFFIEADKINKTGTYPFYIQINSSVSATRFTIAHGFLNVIDPLLST